jgi:hypothetical protein
MHDGDSGRMMLISEIVEEALVLVLLHYANIVWRDGRRLKTPQNTSFRTDIST